MDDVTEDLVKAAVAGDIAAFEAIYRKYASFVYNVAYRITPLKEDAQEITQEVFITVHRQLAGFQFKSSLKTWLYRVTVNCALNMLKKKKRECKDVSYIDESYETPDQQNLLEELIKNEDQQHQIERLLRVLNPDERAAIVLRNIEGLSYEEIAQSLNLNINTVRTRLKRAREKMLKIAEEVKIL